MNQITGGMIFAPMNYFVHSVMYFYYFLMACGIKVWWGKFVTYIQITQMFVGLFTVLSHYLFWSRIKNCDGSGKDFLFAFCMYLSYLILFLKFFFGKYLGGGGDKKKKERKQLGDVAAETKKDK